MGWLYEPQWNRILSMVLLWISAISFVRCIQKFNAARRDWHEYVCTSDIVAGVRWLLLAVTALIFSASIFSI